MRVLLLNPHYPLSETPSPPLGLAYLAAALEWAGVEVKILDAVVFPYDATAMEDTLAAFDPQIVGATAVTMNVDKALAMLTDAKRLNPDVMTVMGGPHVSFTAEDILRENPQVDAIVIGEGEQTLIDLTRAVAAGKSLDGIAGLVFRDGDGIRRTGRRAPLADLDAFGLPARHLIALGRYRALHLPVSMTTSRGCPHRCIFCVGRKMVGAKVRYRRPEAVVDEMAYLNTLGFHQINLADDLFTAKAAHCLAVCDEIGRRGLEVTWTSFARVDTVSLEVLSAMRQAGCTAVSFGIETANAAMLKTIKKDITRDMVVEAVKICNQAGMMPFGSFILGLPGETAETIAETVAFGKQMEDLGLGYGFHLLAPFPGTEVRDKAADLGITILTNDWTQYHANRAIVATPGADPAMLNAVVEDWENRYNAYLGEIERQLTAGEIDRNQAFDLINLERVVILYDLMMNRAIEALGAWEQGPRQGDQALEELVRRVQPGLDKPAPKVRDALQSALDAGNLVVDTVGAGVRWRWVDYL